MDKNKTIQDKDLISRLCDAIEKRLGRKMITPRDFEFLAEELSKCGLRISGSTLKRIWGYNRDISDNYRPYRYTLALLANFLGYNGIEDFCNHKDDNDLDSAEFFGSTIMAENIMPGSIVELKWSPQRSCNLICTEKCNFKVLQSERGRLLPGDIVTFMSLTENAPLYFNKVIRPSTSEQFVYTAGLRTGIKYRIHGIVKFDDEDLVIT